MFKIYYVLYQRSSKTNRERVKEALAFIDESNEKIDDLCIILVKFLDPEVGNVITRFFDMPVVNIGTASNLFHAVEECLGKHGLDFSKVLSFMSDTTNVV